MNEKIKCSCGRWMDADSYRCKSCHAAWSEGFSQGQESVKIEVKSFLNKFINND